jgi:hypothetical protein
VSGAFPVVIDEVMVEPIFEGGEETPALVETLDLWRSLSAEEALDLLCAAKERAWSEHHIAVELTADATILTAWHGPHGVTEAPRVRPAHPIAALGSVSPEQKPVIMISRTLVRGGRTRPELRVAAAHGIDAVAARLAALERQPGGPRHLFRYAVSRPGVLTALPACACGICAPPGIVGGLFARVLGEVRALTYRLGGPAAAGLPGLTGGLTILRP